MWALQQEAVGEVCGVQVEEPDWAEQGVQSQEWKASRIDLEQRMKTGLLTEICEDPHGFWHRLELTCHTQAIHFNPIYQFKNWLPILAP